MLLLLVALVLLGLTNLSAAHGGHIDGVHASHGVVPKEGEPSFARMPTGPLQAAARSQQYLPLLGPRAIRGGYTVLLGWPMMRPSAIRPHVRCLPAETTHHKQLGGNIPAMAIRTRGDISEMIPPRSLGGLLTRGQPVLHTWVEAWLPNWLGGTTPGVRCIPANLGSEHDAFIHRKIVHPSPEEEEEEEAPTSHAELLYRERLSTSWDHLPDQDPIANRRPERELAALSMNQFRPEHTPPPLGPVAARDSSSELSPAASKPASSSAQEAADRSVSGAGAVEEQNWRGYKGTGSLLGDSGGLGLPMGDEGIAEAGIAAMEISPRSMGHTESFQVIPPATACCGEGSGTWGPGDAARRLERVWHRRWPQLHQKQSQQQSQTQSQFGGGRGQQRRTPAQISGVPAGWRQSAPGAPAKTIWPYDQPEWTQGRALK